MGLFSLVYVCSMALVVNSLICLDQLKEKPGVYEPIKLADDGKHFCFVGLMLENDVCSAKTGYKVLDKAYKNEVPPCSREGTTVDCLCKEDKCNVRVANLQNKLIEGIVEGGYNGKVLPKFLRCIKEFSSHTWHPLSVATSIRPSRLSSLSSFSTPGSSKTASKLLVSQTSPSTVSMDEKSSTALVNEPSMSTPDETVPQTSSSTKSAVSGKENDDRAPGTQRVPSQAVHQSEKPKTFTDSHKTSSFPPVSSPSQPVSTAPTAVPNVPSTNSGGTTEEIPGTTEDGAVEGGGNEESGKEAAKEEKAGFPEWAIWLLAIVVLSAILGFIIFVVIPKVSDMKEREGQEKKGETESLIPQIVVQKPAVPEVKPAVPEVKPAVPEVKPAVPEVKPAVPEVKPAVPEVKPAVPEVKPAVPEVKPAVPEQKPVVPEQKKASDAAEEKQDPTKKPAAPAKRLTLRQKLEKEAIEREKKKNRRQKLLKADRARKADVFSDRRFQKAGPLKFTHFSKYLPEDNLTSSGSIKGDGPIEFNDRENKIYLMGSEIEEIEPSPEGTQDSEDETQDSVDSTQDSNKVAGQKKAVRKDRKRGEDGKKEKKEKREKNEKKHKRRKKAKDGKSRSKGGTKRHGHKKRSGTKKHRKGHRRSREEASRGSGTKTSGKDQPAVEGSRQSVRSQAAVQAEVAVNEKKGQRPGGSRRQEVEQGK